MDQLNLEYLIWSNSGKMGWLNKNRVLCVCVLWCSIVVRMPVTAGELSLSCARLMAGRVTTLWVRRPAVRYQSTNTANSACHPSGVG